MLNSIEINLEITCHQHTMNIHKHLQQRLCHRRTQDLIVPTHLQYISSPSPIFFTVPLAVSICSSVTNEKQAHKSQFQLFKNCCSPHPKPHTYGPFQPVLPYSTFLLICILPPKSLLYNKALFPSAIIARNNLVRRLRCDCVNVCLCKFYLLKFNLCVPNAKTRL